MTTCRLLSIQSTVPNDQTAAGTVSTGSFSSSAYGRKGDHPVKHQQNVMTMLMQATMFLAQPKRARLLVLLEHTIQTNEFLACGDADAGYYVSSQVNPVKPHAVPVTIRHLPGKRPVMLLMQATMFLAQPKRARLLVLLERLVVTTG